MTSRLRLALIASLLAVPSVASAHLHMAKPIPRVDDVQGGDQKNGPCGSPGYSRAANPSRTTYYKPGETIRVMWQETIPHPGWHRIAIQPNGEQFVYTPASNGPRSNGDPSNFPTLNQTGMTDATTGMIVLLDRIADVGNNTTHMADVTLPNIECSNCTLQVTQFMTDRPEYTTTNGGAVYFNCADIVISNTPPPTTPPPATPDGGPVDPTPEPTEPVDGDLKGTCSTGQAGGFGAALLIGLLALVRRRSSRRA